MSFVSAVNAVAEGAWQYATAAGDRFFKEHLQLAARNFDLHDHAATRGLPAIRIGTAGAPVSVSGTPAVGQALVATSTTAAAWASVGLTKIAEVVLSGTAATIDFSSIPATYRHLLLELYSRGDTAALTTGVSLRYNADTGATYDRQLIYATGATPLAAEALAQTSGRIGTAPAGTATANLFGTIVVDIPHYANSTNKKSAVTRCGVAQGTSTGLFQAEVGATFWTGVAAINQITLLPSAGNFGIGTIASLYALS